MPPLRGLTETERTNRMDKNAFKKTGKALLVVLPLMLLLLAIWIMKGLLRLLSVAREAVVAARYKVGDCTVAASDLGLRLCDWAEADDDQRPPDAAPSL